MVPAEAPTRPDLTATEQDSAIIAGIPDARFWAEALNLGAYDLLAQPFYAPEVRRILYNACSRPSYQTLPMAAV